MLKVLLKKQFGELLAFFTMKGSKGDKRKIGVVIGVAALMVYAFGASAFVFWKLADMICAPYIAMGLDWVYFAFTGTTALAIGCMGSVFVAKTRLYDAKDNETLLAMPIPPSMILLSRVISLYLFGLLFTSLAFIPACVRYFTIVGITFASFFGCLIIVLCLPVLVLVVSCLLGWLIALITARIPAKNLVTVVFLIAFLVLYSTAYSKLQELMNYVVINGELIGETIKTKLFLFWQLGLGATGKLSATLVFLAISVGALALVYWLLSATFLYIVTERRTGKKAKYRETQAKNRSALFALLGKEALRFLKNPMILFNAGLGSMLGVVFVAFAILNGDLVAEINAAPLPKQDIAVIVTLIMLFIVSSNVLTASAVSLEGDNLWLLRSMPVSTEKIFTAKITFHILYTILPITLAQAVLFALLHIPFWLFLLSWTVLASSTLFFALAGLVVNLKLPNLHWTNEIVAVKQSLSVVIAMFGGWGVCALVLGGHFWFGIEIGAWYFVVATLVLTVASVAFALWLKKRGVNAFERL